MLQLDSMERGLFESVECVRFDNCFIEQSTGGILGQPVNTITNLSFIIVALIIIFSLKTKMPKTQQILLGAICAIIGLSSAYYHMTMTFLGQILDLTGMYMVAVFVICYAIMRWRQWGNRQFWLAFILPLIPLLATLVFLPEIRNFVFAGVLLVGLVAEFVIGNKQKYDWRILLGALGVLLVSFTIWLCDVNRIIDFNGHALWHIFNGVAILFLFIYYAKGSKIKQ